MASNSNTQSTPDGQPDSESHKQNGTSQLQTLPGSETDTESTTCEFTLDIEDWNEVHDTNIDVADDPTWDGSVWNCYRKVPAEGDTNYCIFHQNTPEADGVGGREKVRIAKHVSEDDIGVPGDGNGNINVEPSQVFLDLLNGSPDPDDWTEDGQEFPDEIWQVDEKQTNTANEYKRRRKQFIGTVLGDVELTRESLDADDMYPIDLRCVRIINGFDAKNAGICHDLKMQGAQVETLSLEDADVDSVSLKDADVDGRVSLEDADVDGVSLDDADVDGAVSFVDADVVRIIIENSYINDRLSFNQTAAEDCHLRNSIVGDDINLSEITLTGGLYIGYHNDNDDDPIDPVVTGGVVTLEDATIEGESHLCCVPDHPAVGAVVIDDATIESGRFHHIERDTRDTVDYRFTLDSENTVCGFSNSDSNKPDERTADGLVYEFERATLGQTEIAHDSDDSFEHARFLETAFDGFVFSRERDKFRSTGWNVHEPREGGYRDIAIVTQTPPAETESDDSDSYPDTVFGAAQQKVETQIDTWLDMDESNHTETIKTARELVPEDIDTDTDTDTDNLIKPQPGSGDPVTKALKKCHNLKHLEILERIPRRNSETETEDETDSESPFRSRRAKEIQADPDRVAKALVTDSNAAWVASRRVEQIRRSLSDPIMSRDLPDDVSIPKDITDVSDSDFVGQIVTFLDSHPDHDGSVREILTHDDTEFEFPGETVDTVDKRAAVKVSRLARAIHDDRKTLTNKHIIETSFRSRQKSTEDSASGGGDDSEDTDTGSNPNPDTDTDTDTSTSESQDDDNERKQLDNNPGQLEQNPGGETEPPDSLVADAILNTEAVRKAEQKARWLQEDAEYLTARHLSDPEAVTGSNNDLESTYVEAKNGASDMGDEVAAGNFFQIERAYGRRQHWDGFKGELGQKNGSNNGEGLSRMLERPSSLKQLLLTVAGVVGVMFGVLNMLLSVLNISTVTHGDHLDLLWVQFGLPEVTWVVRFLAAGTCFLVSLVPLSIGLYGIRRSRMLYNWIANVFLWVTTGYGEKPMRVLGSSLGIIFAAAVIFAQFGSGAFKPGSGPHGESGWVPYLILSFESFVTLVLGSPNIDNTYLRLLAEIEGFIGIFTIGLFVFTLTRAIHR